MGLTPKQTEVMDVLFNGGYIWRVGEVFMLAHASSMANGAVYYKSERINSKTARALINTDLLELRGEFRWFAKGDSHA